MLLDTLPEGGLLAIHWTFCSAALVFVIARTCVRLKTSGHLMLDDYIMYAAWAVLLANTILQTLQNHSTYIMSKGFQGLLPLGAKFMAAGNIYVRYEFVSIGLFWTVTWLVKASFLAFYWRLLNGLVLYQKMWYAICVFSFLAYLGCWISSVLNCDPVSDYWDFGTYYQFLLCLLYGRTTINNPDAGKCTSAADERRGTISIAYSTAVDILTDILIMVLPLVLVYKVRISRQQKFGLCAVFMLALVTITIAIVRCVQAIRNQRELIFLALWGTIESATGALPVLSLCCCCCYYSERC